MPTNAVVQLEKTYVPAAVSSARTLFSTLLGWQVEPYVEETLGEFAPGLDISGIIGFTGVLRVRSSSVLIKLLRSQPCKLCW